MIQDVEAAIDSRLTNNPSLHSNTMAPIIQFKAGRSFREGETNQVVSQPDRG